MVVHLSLNFVIEMVSDCISDTLTFNFFPGGGGGAEHLVSLGMYWAPPVDFPKIATARWEVESGTGFTSLGISLSI